MKRLIFAVAMMGLCVLVPTARAERTNVIVMLVDDWGWRDAGCFGSDLYETPNIDRLAARGMKFTNGYAACTVCSPTRATMMTGMYPGRTHVTDWIPGHVKPKDDMQVPDWTQRLELKHTTLAEAMRAGGYHTAHVGKWHLTPRSYDSAELEPYYPQNQGFEINIAGNQWGAPGSYYYPYRRGKQTGIKSRTVNFPADIPEGRYLTDMLADHALRIIKQWGDEPFFMYWATYAVHTPLQGRADLVKEYKPKIKPGMQHNNADYAAMVTAVDEALGRLVDTLEAQGIADRTVIILTGDNGGLQGRSTDNSPLRAGKGSAYEGGVRVPTVIFWPGVTPPGSVCDEPVITTDYYPTVLEITGVTGNAQHNASVDGHSLVPLLKNPDAQFDRDAIYWHYPHYHPGGASPYAAIRARDWRLVEFYEDNHVELYNLADDIGEKHNLAKSNPAKAKQLTDKLHAWQKTVGAQFATKKSQ
ncbi:sulfatase [Planctomycetales bacterium ZRK34]|nr:sulfatase [Planctomycetales bacterium ZRK34]